MADGSAHSSAHSSIGVDSTPAVTLAHCTPVARLSLSVAGQTDRLLGPPASPLTDTYSPLPSVTPPPRSRCPAARTSRRRRRRDVVSSSSKPLASSPPRRWTNGRAVRAAVGAAHRYTHAAHVGDAAAAVALPGSAVVVVGDFNDVSSSINFFAPLYRVVLYYTHTLSLFATIVYTILHDSFRPPLLTQSCGVRRNLRQPHHRPLTAAVTPTTTTATTATAAATAAGDNEVCLRRYLPQCQLRRPFTWYLQSALQVLVFAL